MVYIQDKEITILLIQGYPGRRPQILDGTRLGTPFLSRVKSFYSKKCKTSGYFLDSNYSRVGPSFSPKRPHIWDIFIGTAGTDGTVPVKTQEQIHQGLVYVRPFKRSK